MGFSIEDGHRAWAEVDLGAVAHNLAVAKSRAPGAGVIAVVKADAYGHGLERICRCLADGVAYFGVASIAEARVIAEALGSDYSNILIMGASLPEELGVAIGSGWHLSVSSGNDLRMIAEQARRLGLEAGVHLVVDTGMGRMGALESEFLELCQSAQGRENVTVRGLASHLPCADEDLEFTRTQLGQFGRLVKRAVSLWESPVTPLVHVLNSAGVCRFGEGAEGGLTRPGLMLYGVAPELEFQGELRAVMRLKTRVHLVRHLPAGRGISYGRTFITERQTRVATLGIGYGDGYPRSLSGRGAEVLIRGERCSLLGCVTMDQIMVDVTDVAERVEAGDEVILFGRQGDDEVPVAELARKAGTIPWEILTNITKRVPRIYRG